MRSFLGHSGVCDTCGAFAHLWVTPDVDGAPQRCDDCETRHTVRAAYAADPAWAQRIYCAASPEAALRLLGVPEN